MTVHEALRAQFKAMKNRPLKENIAYLWDYYGMKAILLLVVLILLIGQIVSMLSQKDPVFCGVFFGVSLQPESEDYLQNFANEAGIDPEHYELSVQVSPDIRPFDAVTEDEYYHMQRFTAMVSARSVEVIAANPDLYLYYSYGSYTYDLRNVFSLEELSALSAHLYYIDGELLAFLENNDNPEFTLDQYPDPAKPEEMADPIPVAVGIQATTQAFQNSYPFVTKDVMLGICLNSENLDNAQSFLRYALDLSLQERTP